MFDVTVTARRLQWRPHGTKFELKTGIWKAEYEIQRNPQYSTCQTIAPFEGDISVWVIMRMRGMK